jgi:hypothetical protein
VCFASSLAWRSDIQRALLGRGFERVLVKSGFEIWRRTDG